MTSFLFTLAMLCAAPVVPIDSSSYVETFAQELVTFFDSADGLPSADVRAIALLADGVPLALVEGGYARFNGNTWAFHALESGEGLAFLEAATDGSPTFWIAGGDRVLHVGDSVETVRLPEGAVTALAAVGSGVYVGTTQGIWRVEAGRKRRLLRVDYPALALAQVEDTLYLGTDRGLLQFGLTGRRSKPGAMFPQDEIYSWAPTDVTALAASGGTLWMGSREGAGQFANNQWSLFTGEDGLPYTNFTCADMGEPGVVWFGTERGAIRYDGENWFYRAGKRWIPDDKVNDIAVADDGTAWIATPAGISRITRTQRTLAEKAAEFERIIDARHHRLGKFVLRCYFDEPGALDKSSQRATDNDGLYTSMYGASQCFRYAATKDPAVKERVKGIFEGVKLLFDVTGIPGFPARSVIPVEGNEDPNVGFGEAQNLAIQKEDPLWKNIVPRWPLSADGQYWWKCDTSSDETCGHYFFFALYHDLVCETDAERKEVADLVHAMTSHIVDHNFTLTDHDGKPTRWANWSPEYVNGEHGWADRGIQSIEILSYMNVALHITGDRKFAKAAKYLRDEHDYHANAIKGRSAWPPAAVVPWDPNLAFLSFYGLIEYEQDPGLKRLYELSLDNNWLFLARQNDPFFNTVWLVLHPEDGLETEPEEAQAERERTLDRTVKTLARTPQLLIDWRMENSHRSDVYLDPTLRQRDNYGWLRTGEAVPIEERSHIRINSDHFDLNWGGEGKTEYEGTFYLLPYYMARYYGLLKE
jgi:hypothetical protein